VLLMGTGPAGRAEDKDNVLADELRLKAAFLPTDGPGLVNFLRVRARGEASKDTLAKLVERLSDESVAVRHKAAGELVAIGPPRGAVPRAAPPPDAAGGPGGRPQPREPAPPGLPGSATGLRAPRRPLGTAQALLAYLPHAENDSVMEEAKAALIGVSYYKGK